MKTIKAHKGVVYFPTRQDAEAFAQHCGIASTPISSTRGWTLKPIQQAPQQEATK